MKPGGINPPPSQEQNDSQPLPVFPSRFEESKEVELEKFVEQILRAERVCLGKSWVRRVLVKFRNSAERNWEDRISLEETEASN